MCCAATGLACGCSGWRWQLQDLVQQHKMSPDFLGGDMMQQQQQPAQAVSQQQPQQQLPHVSDPDAQRQWQQQVRRRVQVLVLAGC